MNQIVYYINCCQERIKEEEQLEGFMVLVCPHRILLLQGIILVVVVFADF